MSQTFYTDNIPSISNSFQILVQPVDITCSLGNSVNLSAVVNSYNPSYQWYDRFGKPINMQTNSNLFLRSVRNEDFGFYTLEIVDLTTREKVLTRWVEIKRNVIGTETIKTPQTTTSKPILLSSSPGGSYRIGSTLTLNACFRNATAYQWYKDGDRLEGCTGNSITIHNANVYNSGQYMLAALNGTNSRVMELTGPIKVIVN